MPYVVIIKWGADFFLMGSGQLKIIGFMTEMDALEYYEERSPAGEELEWNGKPVKPSIVMVPRFKDITNRIIQINPPIIRAEDKPECWVMISANRSACYYWSKGRHQGFAWLRKGELSAKVKLTGREEEIASMLKAGMSENQISAAIGVHYQTVVAFVDQMELRRHLVNNNREE